MKVTVEISDAIHRRAKARAAESGISLPQFVTETIQDDLNKPGPKRWMKHVGKLKHLKRDIVLVDRVIEEFEKIDPEHWT